MGRLLEPPICIWLVRITENSLRLRAWLSGMWKCSGSPSMKALSSREARHKRERNALLLGFCEGFTTVIIDLVIGHWLNQSPVLALGWGPKVSH